MRSNPPVPEDFLSQEALGKPLPLSAPHFRHEWQGLPVFDSIAVLERVGRARGWKIGAYIAELRIPDDAPLSYVGPGRSGHWLIYQSSGEMLMLEQAPQFLTWIVNVTYGPTMQAVSWMCSAVVELVLQ